MVESKQRTCLYVIHGLRTTFTLKTSAIKKFEGGENQMETLTHNNDQPVQQTTKSSTPTWCTSNSWPTRPYQKSSIFQIFHGIMQQLGIRNNLEFWTIAQGQHKPKWRTKADQIVYKTLNDKLCHNPRSTIFQTHHEIMHNRRHKGVWNIGQLSNKDQQRRPIAKDHSFINRSQVFTIYNFF